jgi:hypothetical protein
MVVEWILALEYGVEVTLNWKHKGGREEEREMEEEKEEDEEDEEEEQ